MNEELEKAWRDIIIDHSQFPRRQGGLEGASHSGHGENPFCGDRVQVHMSIDETGLITDIKVSASGCAISLASASLLSSSLAERDIAHAESLFNSVRQMIIGQHEATDTDLGELQALSLVSRYPSRVKCATLVWHVMHSALHGADELVTTE